MSIQMVTFPVYPLGCNCTILYSEESHKAVVIDPGGEDQKILSFLKEKQLILTDILHTHAHFDHCLGSSRLKDAHLDSRLALHREDLPLYENLEMQCRMFGVPFSKEPIREIGHFLEDEERLISPDSSHFEVLFTPGHTPGSVCFLLKTEKDQFLFSGDTLFSGSIGRTDLWGGDSEKILRSIEDRIFRLEEETIVIPGHGEMTSVLREKRSNPFFT
ncbi:MAG: MBL fold metallo-hydrolase [Leptospiraceae bacterium]|nr:MBL fold metallo-hydrolase [Leptospiraceae bacterium]MCP5510454.1 MBL fold metallo-hydrolase [Leptospiraceae bacterium]